MDDGLSSSVPDWVQEMQDTETLRIRKDIVGTINRYCAANEIKHYLIWKKVYETFTRRTGIGFNNWSGTKLDLVEQSNELGMLHRIVQEVCWKRK